MANPVYLIGDMNEKLVGRKLPTVREVMSLFFYQTRLCNSSVKRSVSITIEKVEEKWMHAGIPVLKKKNVIGKLLKIYYTWQNLNKNRKRKNSPAQKKKKALFIEKSEKLFDIARSNVDKDLDDDKRTFLKAQRSPGRYGFTDISVPHSSPGQFEENTMDVDVDGDYFSFCIREFRRDEIIQTLIVIRLIIFYFFYSCSLVIIINKPFNV